MFGYVLPLLTGHHSDDTHHDEDEAPKRVAESL